MMLMLMMREECCVSPIHKEKFMREDVSFQFLFSSSFIHSSTPFTTWD